MANVLDCNIEASSNSSQAIVFFFGFIPLGKVDNPFIPVIGEILSLLFFDKDGFGIK